MRGKKGASRLHAACEWEPAAWAARGAAPLSQQAIGAQAFGACSLIAPQAVVSTMDVLTCFSSHLEVRVRTRRVTFVVYEYCPQASIAARAATCSAGRARNPPCLSMG